MGAERVDMRTFDRQASEFTAAFKPQLTPCGALWRHQLRQLWPMLLGVLLLLMLALACQQLMVMSSLMQRGHGRWVQATHGATRALNQFAHDCRISGLQQHQKDMEVLRAYAELMARMRQDPPDFEGAGHAARLSDPDSTRTRLHLWLMHQSRDLPAMASAYLLWSEAAALIPSIDALAASIVREVLVHGCIDPGAHEALKQEIYRIEDRMEPLVSAFGKRARLVHERMERVTQIVLLSGGLSVVLLGLVFARRTVRVQRRAEMAELAERQARWRSVRAMRHLMGTLGHVQEESPLARLEEPPAEHLDDILRQVQSLAERQRADQGALQAIFDRSPDAFVSFDGTGRVRAASAAFAPLTGYAEGEVIGLSAPELLARLEGEPADCESTVRDATVATQPALVEQLLSLPGPAPKELLVIPLHDPEHGGPLALCLRDVTRAQALERMKSEFITTAAHELRTPMASIVGFVELLRTRAMGDARRTEVLDIVWRQSKRMVGILNELLDLSRLESRGRAALQLQRLDLRTLAESAAQTCAVPIDRHRPQLLLAEAPAWVRVDPQMLMRVLDNLLSNAYKFSSAGSGAVLLQLQRRDVHGGGSLVGLCVQDHGIGMTPEQLSRVGERFYRADTSGHIAGTGLGVSMVLEILQLHGGSLELQSSPGKGTRCVAWLPTDE